jgi:hypothetical protein
MRVVLVVGVAAVDRVLQAFGVFVEMRPVRTRPA